MRGNRIVWLLAACCFMLSCSQQFILGVPDRIAVMAEGCRTGILSCEEATQEKIMQLATKFSGGESHDGKEAI